VVSERSQLGGGGGGMGWPRSLGDQMTAAMVAANLVVYLGWQSSRVRPQMARFMVKHFTSSLENMQHRRYHTLVTSMFSHAGIVHLGLNMLTLSSFLPAMIRAPADRGFLSSHRSDRRRTRGLTPDRFLSLYFASGVVSSLASIYVHNLLRRNTIGLGASGAIFGILSYFCLEHPDARLRLFFLLDLTAAQALALGTFINVGLVVAARTRHTVVDGAGHLGGTALGAIAFLAHGAGWW
jgi:rhomboid-like protein